MVEHYYHRCITIIKVYLDLLYYIKCNICYLNIKYIFTVDTHGLHTELGTILKKYIIDTITITHFFL